MHSPIMILDSDLSYEGLERFREKLLPILQTAEHDIILDFSKITLSLDSSAIGELMKFHSILESKNFKLCLLNVNKLIKTVFKLNKLDTILTLIES